MQFPYAYSAVARNARPSPIRELFRVIGRPGMISLAGGLPDPSAFPVDPFLDCTEVLEDWAATALQYGATEGYGPLVEWIVDRVAGRTGTRLEPADVLVTTGSQQVMDLLARVLLDPGDVVVVEAPTYPGALHTFRNVGARFAQVPCDDSGMQFEALDEVVRTVRRDAGSPPKLIYTIVNFSNPSGACLTEERRRRLVEYAASTGIPILEDDPYGDLRYVGAPLAPLFGRDPASGVIHAGSFSKILAPGVRLAWAVGDADLIRRMAILKQGVDLCTSTLDQVLVAEYCRRGHLDRHLERMRDHYRVKRDAMADALARNLSGTPAIWHDPEGGFFFWLDLGQDSGPVFDRALEEGVAFLPGRVFFPDADETVGRAFPGNRYARLCFTFAAPEQIGEGCGRLARALAGDARTPTATRRTV